TSCGLMPASSSAALQASSASCRSDLPDSFENSVAPMPEIADLSTISRILERLRVSEIEVRLTGDMSAECITAFDRHPHSAVVRDVVHHACQGHLIPGEVRCPQFDAQLLHPGGRAGPFG